MKEIRIVRATFNSKSLTLQIIDLRRKKSFHCGSTIDCSEQSIATCYSLRVKMLLSTTNKGKLRELTALLSDLDINLVGLNESESTEEVETADTFSANALLKARHYHNRSKLPTLAEDSGLEVFALHGAPGVYSARYGGSKATDAMRIAKLMDEMKDIPEEDRTARFVCSAAIVWATGERVFGGEVGGRILTEPRGDGGFGYDPIFFYEPLGKSFAELTLIEKAKVSHRGIAFDDLVRWLREQGVLDTISSGDKISDPTTITSASVNLKR